MLDKLQEIIGQYCDNEGLALAEDMTLTTDLGLSSMDFLAMVVDIEDAFDVKIPDNELLEFRTVRDLVNSIAAQQGA